MKRKFISLVTACVLSISVLGGCGEKKSDAVPVQSISALNGMFGTMQQQIFVGVVSTGNEANIKKDGNKKVAKVNVKKGDIVKEGDVLFTYDAQQAKDSLEKAKLELEELQNSLESKEEEKKQLEEGQKKAKQDDQLEYTLKIQETDTDIRETKYNIGLKENEIRKLENSTEDLDVTAPFGGRIESAGTADSSTSSEGFDLDSDDDYSYDDSGSGESGSGEAFIKLVETDNYRIKGTINETNIQDIYIDMPMVIHSRTEEDLVWYGSVSEIETKTPNKKSSDEDYYDSGSSDSEMTSSSSYPFYVSIDALEGLMIGQHVYMSAYDPDSEEGSIRLNASFICDPDGSPYVWAAKNGVLEKRSVTLDEYDEGADSYYILDGLTMEDYIASPTDSLKEGMPVVEHDGEVFREYVDSLEDQTSASASSGKDDEEDFDDEDFGDEDFDDELDDEFYDDDDDSFDAIDFDDLDAGFEEAVG